MGLLKLVASFLFIAYLLQSGPAHCQQPSLITLTEKDVPLKKALDDIHEKTGVPYFGAVDFIHQGRNVSFSVVNATLAQVLDSCFRDQPFSYRLVSGGISIQAPEQKGRIIHGVVFNDKDEPLGGVSVLVKGDAKAATATTNKGEFLIHIHSADPTLIFSSVSYETQILRVAEEKELKIHLQDKVSQLDDVVVINTGYQRTRRQGTTGSFDQVDNDLIGRRVSPNILDRIDGVTSGVLFNKNILTGTNQSTITIRGRSTIFSNPNPLIVIDNFPYTGDVNNINPDDVESITILKDAAAASIWGALSGNGVIVITTKKGRLNQPPRFSFNTSQTVGQKPNLNYLPILSSSDYIDVENYLFHQGFYNPSLASAQYTALTPVVNLLYQDSLHQITDPQAQAQINVLRGQDSRTGLNQYFYRPSLNSQYSLSLSGGGDHNQYFLSAGYDADLSNMVRNEYDRVTLNGNNTYYLLQGKLEFSTGFTFTASNTTNNNIGATGVVYPYAQVADARGNPLPVAFGLNETYIDTAGGGRLLDWHYRPLQELQNADNPTRLTDYRINIGGRYTVWKGLSIGASYQFGRGVSDNPNYQSLQTYATRSVINEFTQVSGGVLTYPVPAGGILNESMTTYTANNIRAQLNYNDSLFRYGMLNIIGGAELRDIESENTMITLYGYDPDQQSGVPVDYVDYFPQYSSGTLAKIPYNDSKLGTSERYISYYSNAAYTYLDRYVLSASARRDESNLFGVSADKKGVPLWSVGGAWEVSRQPFYHASWLPFFRLRVTDGYNGNVDRSVSAYTTANVVSQGNNYGTISASIINPPNADLRWERIHIFNFGADFSGRNDRLGGSVEYYMKTGLDLIGQSPVDPTTGVSTFTGNTANIRDRGLDITLHSNNSFGAFRWNSILLFSYVRDKVTKYAQQQGAVQDYFSAATINPLVGRPLYSLYALRWGGLDPQTGDPIGYLKGQNGQAGQATEDYNSILNSSDLGNLVYKGPVNPPYFGSWRNSLYWRQWGISCNVIYKMGYVFRRSSINYYALFSGLSAGSPDYDRRWQHAGDEEHTSVPSLPVPNMTLIVPRDNFYTNSEVLVEKGDQVRLQDIQVSYDLARSAHPKLPVRLLRFYVYANNIGIIWKANHSGIDPDFVSTIPNPRTLALGMKVDF
jgi:TonB-linked SusC/RagA family outer membrane protein